MRSDTAQADQKKYISITEEQRLFVDQYGYLVIENALPPSLLETVNAAVDELYIQAEQEGTLQDDGQLNMRNCITQHPAFLPLLDWPATVPLAWGVLNWNIQMLTSHLIVLPSGPEPDEVLMRKHGMHRDGGTSPQEMQEPHPRIMLKIGYVLSDQTDPATGATRLVPGSNRLQGKPANDPATGWPYGTIQMNLPAGSAFLFEQRTYHSIGRNWSGHPRKTLFMGYGYRWVKPMDYITMPDSLIARCTPIQKQLLGVVDEALSYYLPKDEDVPLKTFLTESGI